MSLLKRVQELWKGKPVAVEAPLLSFAVVPAARMSQGESPFDEWRPPDEDIPEEHFADFKGCVWVFQMYVFFLLAEARFGSDAAETILRHQVQFLDALATGSGEELKGGMERMKETVHAVSQNPEMKVDGKKVAVPLEYAIAYAFFPKTSWETAASLARCLEHGKSSARSVFEPFIQAARIENGNVVVQPASQ